LAAAAAKVSATWSHLGSECPHFSVLTHDAFLPENLDGSLDDFWRTGEAEAAMVKRVLVRQGLTTCAQKTCLEYGCGVGRVTMALARHFAHIHGYDISASHLEHAQLRAREIGAVNVSLHQCPAGVPEPLQACDVFYSRIVLQHNPPPLIAEILKSALRALNPGGIAIFQVPTYCVGYEFRITEWLAAAPAREMEMHCLPQERVFELITLARCVPLEVWEDNSTGAPTRFVSNTFVVRKIPANQVR
jgi:SAM-dependent methyltransferase